MIRLPPGYTSWSMRRLGVRASGEALRMLARGQKSGRVSRVLALDRIYPPAFTRREIDTIPKLFKAIRLTHKQMYLRGRIKAFRAKVVERLPGTLKTRPATYILTGSQLGVGRIGGFAKKLSRMVRTTRGQARGAFAKGHPFYGNQYVKVRGTIRPPLSKSRLARFASRAKVLGFGRKG